MTDITKLPANWRKEADAHYDAGLTGYNRVCDVITDCADELEALLPKWTRITEDESSWPEEHQDILHTLPDALYSVFHRPEVSTFHNSGKSRYIGHYWRPLIPGIDTPPEDE